MQTWAEVDGEAVEALEGCGIGKVKQRSSTFALSSTAVARPLHRRTWHRPVGTENAAIPGLWLQHRLAIPARIEPLASICRHRFGCNMTTLRAGQIGNEGHFAWRRCHNAYPKMQRKMPNAGSNTKSSIARSPARPRPASSQTSNGVKQHSAVTTAPTIPMLRSLSFIGWLATTSTWHFQQMPAKSVALLKSQTPALQCWQALLTVAAFPCRLMVAGC